jgi:hypothetical protein
MAADWKFYKGELLKNFSNERFLKGEYIGYGLQLAPVVVQTKDFSWLVGGTVANTKQYSWKIGGTVARTRQCSWKVGGIISQYKTFNWLVNGRINMAFGLQAYKFIRYRVPNNVNYGLYRIFDVTNGSGSPYPIYSTVDYIIDHAAMVTAGESDEYGDQLRLTYAPANEAEREIDLEVINPNTATCTLRFKLQRGLNNGGTVSDYRLYSTIQNSDFFEETFRDLKNVYYFYANQLSSNLALTNGTWSNETTGIKRVDDGMVSRLGFNVPSNADIEIEFRFLDAGAADQSKFIGIEWRGDGNASRTFSLDNDNSVTDNQILNYNDGTGWSALGSPVASIKTIPAKMRINVSGNNVNMYLNGVLVSTIVDATAPTGGMSIVLPIGSESLIHSIRVKEAITGESLVLNSPITNVKDVPSSHKVLLRDGSVQNVQATIIRLKRQPDNSFTLEDMKTVGEFGDSFPATTNQDNSIEIHLYNTANKTLANVMELKT